MMDKVSYLSVCRSIFESYLVGTFLGVILACTIATPVTFINSGYDLRAFITIILLPMVWLLACYHLMPSLAIAVWLASMRRFALHPKRSCSVQLSPFAALLLWGLLVAVAFGAVHFLPAIFAPTSLWWNTPVAAVCVGISIFVFPKLIARQAHEPSEVASDLTLGKVRVTSMKNW